MTVNVEQAQSSLPELIRRTSAGETVVITQGNQPVAELRPIAGGRGTPRFGSCKGMLTEIGEVDDDDDHLGDFAEYLK